MRPAEAVLQTEAFAYGLLIGQVEGAFKSIFVGQGNVGSLSYRDAYGIARLKVIEDALPAKGDEVVRVDIIGHLRLEGVGAYLGVPVKAVFV